MVHRIRKWGNSLSVRLPKSYADSLGLKDGSALDILLEDKQLILRPMPKNKYSFEDLVSKITEENIHGEVGFGQAGGELI